jgi:hypothetical protein
MGVEKNTRTLIAAVSAIVVFAGAAYGASDYSDLQLKQDVDAAGGAVPKSNAAMKASRQACGDLLPTQSVDSVVCEGHGTVTAWLPGSRAAAAHPDGGVHDHASSLREADGKGPAVTGRAVQRRGIVVYEPPCLGLVKISSSASSGRRAVIPFPPSRPITGDTMLDVTKETRLLDMQKKSADPFRKAAASRKRLRTVRFNSLESATSIASR